MKMTDIHNWKHMYKFEHENYPCSENNMNYFDVVLWLGLIVWFHVEVVPRQLSVIRKYVMEKRIILVNLLKSEGFFYNFDRPKGQIL